ncbi:hypothetical protein [Pandoraea oxalativorans]|nr:hypothetical protein [Pandoraea oxalativorans]
MLNTPLELRKDGQFMAKVTVAGPHGEISIGLALVPECFHEYAYGRDDKGRLTADDFARSRWMDTNADNENVLLRQLADFAQTAPQLLRDNRDTVELIMTGIMRAAPTPENECLCQALAKAKIYVRPFVAGQSYYEMQAHYLNMGLPDDDASQRALQQAAAEAGFMGNAHFHRLDRL